MIGVVIAVGKEVYDRASKPLMNDLAERLLLPLQEKGAAEIAFNDLMILSATMQNPTAAEKMFEHGLMDFLLQVAEKNPDPNTAVQSAAILCAMAEKEETRDLLYMDEKIIEKMVHAVVYSQPLPSSFILQTITNLCYNSKEFRAEFIEKKGFMLVCRAVRSVKNEVAGAANDVLMAFLGDWPDVKAMGLSKKDQDIVSHAVTYLAMAAQEQNMPWQACLAFEQACKTNSQPAMLTQWGVELVKLGKTEEAAEKFELSLRQNPNQVEPAFHLAKQIVKDGKDSTSSLNEAMDVLAAGLVELKPGADSSHPITSPVYGLLVNILEKLGRFDEALQHAREWTYRCNSDAISHYSVGRLLAKEKRFAEALVPLKNAMRLKPTKPEIAYQLALCEGRLDNQEEAIRWCREVIRLEERSRNDRTVRAEIRARQAGLEEKPAPEPKSVVLVPTYMLLGKILSQQKDWAGADEAFQKVLELRPKLARAHVGRGEALRHKGFGALAAESYLSALGTWQEACSGQACDKFMKAHSAEAASLQQISDLCAVGDSTNALTAEQLEAVCNRHNELMR